VLKDSINLFDFGTDPVLHLRRENQKYLEQSLYANIIIRFFEG